MSDQFKRFLPWFVLICMLDFGLRIGALTFDSLYLDESYQSMYESTGQPLVPLMQYHGEKYLFRFDEPHSLNDLFAHFRDVDPLCPPLYGVILNRWRLAFGSSDFALRSLSVVFSVMADLAVMTIAALLFNFQTALFAGCLQALSPFDVTYGQEVRMYSLELFLSAASTALMVWLIRASSVRKRLISSVLYAVSVWALIHTHYTAAFTVAFQGLFALGVCWQRKDAKLFAWFIGSAALTMLLWWPWFSYFLQSSSVRNTTFFVSRQPSWSWPFVALLLRVPSNWVCFLSSSHVPWFLFPLYVTSFVVLTCGIVLAIKSLRARQPDQNQGAQSAWFLLLLWLVVPSLTLWALDVVETRRVIEYGRYLIGSSPAVYILASLGSLWLLKRHKIGLPILFIHSALSLSCIAYYHATPQRREWRVIAHKVEQVVQPDDLIFVSQYYSIPPLDRYLTRPFRQVGLSPQMGRDYTVKTILSFPQLERFWLISCEDGEPIVEMIPPQFSRVNEVRFSHNLHLYLYQRVATPVAPPAVP